MEYDFLKFMLVGEGCPKEPHCWKPGTVELMFKNYPFTPLPIVGDNRIGGGLMLPLEYNKEKGS